MLRGLVKLKIESKNYYYRASFYIYVYLYTVRVLMYERWYKRDYIYIPPHITDRNLRRTLYIYWDRRAFSLPPSSSHPPLSIDISTRLSVGSNEIIGRA